MSQPVFALTLILVLAQPARLSAEETLESRLMPLIEGHKGKVAVAVKHLETGESFMYHENDAMPTASLIKFPVMIEAYRQAQEHKIDLAKMVTLEKSDQVPGSGILTQLTPGLALSVRDLIRLMIGLSDNTATNMVLDQIGIGSTAATMEQMGYPNTKIHAKSFRRDTSVFPERSKQYGLGSTTALEMVRLCEALYKKELVSPEACASMTEHLLACDDKDKFPRFLPSGTKVAFKTGSVDEARTAAGIILSKNGPIALCVLSNANEDHRWVPDNAGNRLCAEVAREVFDHFNPPAKESATGSKDD
ncbi:MAG TPA: serine hydrolase [Isosphaeraceae bacterium]|nr:serine hydrolase [Isosphaeraceae bacterium]